jgi:formiminotetrahydrofolate cyclodeaminase
MLKDKTLNEFIGLLASDAPAPGGGSAAALCGALSSALANMVCGLTIGKKKYAEHGEYIKTTAENAVSLSNYFVKLIDEDSNAYSRVSEAMGLQKETVEQKAKRSLIIQEALKNAADVPLKAMSEALECLKLIESSIGKTNKNVASDLGVAAICAEACVKSAMLNVLINLSLIKDEDYKIETKKKADRISAEAMRISERVQEKINSEYLTA